MHTGGGMDVTCCGTDISRYNLGITNSGSLLERGVVVLRLYKTSEICAYSTGLPGIQAM